MARLFLKKGDVDNGGEKDVTALQLCLRDYGHYLGLVDGVFGDMTEEAVNGFQTNHNIVVDGIVGPQTRMMLNIVEISVHVGLGSLE
ncbi:peptidoglycan-binding domain-containing protein [Methanobacterium ferruginis]|jgi:N-acetylmuramoyl-L-alanine amidase|uniref:peptidoglycan-binding domain-containing protein n=1 Tax=Methanobacterium ferruginis TaxID=710191 RepID=UPI002573455F|nr:peptidoglycan-binding domain-containing protein [Methanobacterium ferruginis]MCC7550443.1 peptidoglycan-binding protein [Methanobacterium sp.]BDZ68631.1 hypothetical protein GCM10025860_20790 [Methanobacterium ferruginis]